MELVRKNWQITYSITPYQQQRGLVKVTTYSTYEMHNLTDRPVSYKHGFWLDNLFDDPHISRPRLMQFEMSYGKASYKFKEGDLNFKLVEKEGLIGFERTTEIQPRDQKPPRFSNASEEIFRDHWIEHHTPLQPVTGFTLQVYHPKGMEVEVSVSTRSGQKTPERIDLPNGSKFVYGGVLLPGQSIWTTWRKRTQ